MTAGPPSSKQTPSAEGADEDDYLTMTFEDPTPSNKNETLTQRKKRLAREAEIKSRTKSKAQIAEEERAKRDAALAKTSIDESSKGFKMMAALGYKPGTALGVKRKAEEVDGDTDTRLLEPIGLEMREGKSGIGADAEKKRKFREEVEKMAAGEQKEKVEAGDFRERQQKEREEKKMEGQLFGAMKVAERLEEEDDVVRAEENRRPKTSKPLSQINVLWRGLAKQRVVNERDRRMRYDLHQSLSRLPTYDDPDEDADDKRALGRKSDLEEVDLELDQEDLELDEFESLGVEERLTKLVSHLREKWHYCFWCKYRYPDDQMDGCPGLTEEDHD